jgi:hypothetical protein
VKKESRLGVLLLLPPHPYSSSVYISDCLTRGEGLQTAVELHSRKRPAGKGK